MVFYTRTRRNKRSGVLATPQNLWWMVFRIYLDYLESAICSCKKAICCLRNLYVSCETFVHIDLCKCTHYSGFTWLPLGEWYEQSWKLLNGISLIPISKLIWKLITRGEQLLFNLEIKKKSGSSINPDIQKSKVPSSVNWKVIINWNYFKSMQATMF